MLTKRRPETRPPRTTVALSGTTRHLEARLHHASAVGIEYAQAYLCREGSLKVPAAGVLRRAIDLYMRHLQSLQTLDTAAAASGCTAGQLEVTAVHRACSALRVLPADEQAARERLAVAIEAPHPLPAFISILLGPEAIARVDATTARAEGYASAMPKVRRAASPNGPQFVKGLP